MRRSKLFLFALVIALCSVLFCGIKFKATDLSTSDKISVLGAQVRTSDPMGIRFVGTVDKETYGSADAYGIAIAFGEVDKSQVVLGNTIDEYEVLYAEVGAVDEDNQFYISLVNIPENMLLQDVTARAYVKVGETVTYAADAVTRNFADVALVYKNSTSYVENETIETLVANLNTNYKKAYFHSVTGNYVVDNAVVETNPANLEKEFVKDWNAKFGTEWTDLTYTNLQTSAIVTSDESTFNSSSTDCSKTNMYAFFNDAVYGAKWGWLLNFFLNETNSRIHPKLQIKAIQEGGSSEVDAWGTPVSKLWSFQHLSSSIINFFDGGNRRSPDNNDINFTSAEYSTYASVVEYSKVYANLTNSDLCAVAGEIELPLPTLEKEGYYFAGYELNDVATENTYIVTAENVEFVPTFTPVEYTIKFYNGAEELTELAGTYNIEQSVVLPTFELEGYKFLGWYDNAECEGEAVTSIALGSTGAKVYYASFEQGFTVTYNFNGGNILYATREEMVADFLKDAIAYYNSLCKEDKKITDTPNCMATTKGTSRNNVDTPIGYADQFGKDTNVNIYNFINTSSKWTWLKTYIIANDSSANITNGHEATWRYSIGAFLFKDQNTSWPATADYTVTDVNGGKLANGFWDTLSAAQQNKFAAVLGDFPIASDKIFKPGYTFVGWYTTEDCQDGTEITVITSECTLYAKWEAIE